MESDVCVIFDDLTDEERQHLVMCIARIEKTRLIYRLTENHFPLQAAQEAMDTCCREIYEKYQ